MFISTYNITPNDITCNPSRKLVVDNFTSFTELGHLPDWYEGEDAGRAAGAGAAR